MSQMELKMESGLLPLLKHTLLTLGIVLLASLVRWRLMPKEEREWWDVLTFALYGLFVLLALYWGLAHTDLEEGTIRVIGMGGAFLANEILTGLLRVAVKVIPALEDRALDIVKRGKL